MHCKRETKAGEVDVRTTARGALLAISSPEAERCRSRRGASNPGGDRAHCKGETKAEEERLTQKEIERIAKEETEAGEERPTQMTLAHTSKPPASEA